MATKESWLSFSSGKFNWAAKHIGYVFPVNNLPSVYYSFSAGYVKKSNIFMCQNRNNVSYIIDVSEENLANVLSRLKELNKIDPNEKGDK